MPSGFGDCTATAKASIWSGPGRESGCLAASRPYLDDREGVDSGETAAEGEAKGQAEGEAAGQAKE